MHQGLVSEVRQSLTLLASVALAVAAPIALGLLAIRLLG
jgi:hypothetical protein